MIAESSATIGAFVTATLALIGTITGAMFILKSKDRENNAPSEIAEGYSGLLAEKKQQFNEYKEEVAADLAEKDARIADLEAKVAEAEVHRIEREQEHGRCLMKISDMQSRIDRQDVQIERQAKQITGQGEQIKNQNELIEVMRQEIRRLGGNMV